ncbi:MAG: hypothetical protein QNJ73_08995 [Gammaproteobacteria bacterium]|nr:hypothetical protein [Gammaproteobacteria bacterium]
MTRILLTLTLSVSFVQAQAALVDNGGGLIYDTVLDITWAQPDETFRTWNDANAWVAGLTLGGVDGWRLPYISVAAGAGPFTGSPVNCSSATELACRDNEMGYMFFQNLSGVLGFSIFEPNFVPNTDPDLALFPGLRAGRYWSGTEFETDVSAWDVGFDSGGSGLGGQTDGEFAWAVHDGNIIPIPAALWLFASGLGLLGWLKRRTG